VKDPICTKPAVGLVSIAPYPQVRNGAFGLRLLLLAVCSCPAEPSVGPLPSPKPVAGRDALQGIGCPRVADCAGLWLLDPRVGPLCALRIGGRAHDTADDGRRCGAKISGAALPLCQTTVQKFQAAELAQPDLCEGHRHAHSFGCGARWQAPPPEIEAALNDFRVAAGDNVSFFYQRLACESIRQGSNNGADTTSRSSTGCRTGG